MFRRSVLSLLMFLSLGASAGSFDYLPAGSGPEKEFQALMNSGNFRQALMTWSTAHGTTAFAQSANGQATYAYLLYQNGMPFLGLEWLLETTQPSRLNGQLLKLWTNELKSSHFIQKGWIPTTGGWKSIANNEPVQLVLRNKKDIAKAFAKADARGSDVNAKVRILWQIATLAPLAGELDQSLKALKILKESGQTIIGQDLIASVQARVLYQKGDIDGALMSFQQIPKGSTLWVESVEERAWAFLRKDDYDRALGEATTLLSPALVPLVGPESYFLTNLMALKVCDYPRIFKTSELFKKRHRERLANMQDLAKTGTHKTLGAALERVEQKGVSIEGAGPMVDALPRSAFRDQKFLRFMESRRQLNSETKKAAELSAEAALGGSLERLVQLGRTQSDRLKQLASQRVRVLAQNEVDEYRKILNKMHIVEAEVIQRLHVDESLKGERGKLAKIEKDKDVLVFPYTSDEVWFDELDNYRAQVKDCPTAKGAGL